MRPCDFPYSGEFEHGLSLHVSSGLNIKEIQGPKDKNMARKCDFAVVKKTWKCYNKII